MSQEATAEEVRLILRLTGATALITSVWRAHDVLRMRDSEHAVPRLRLVVTVPGTWPEAAVPADAVDRFTLLNHRPVEPASRTDQDQVYLLAWAEDIGGTPACVQHTHRSLPAGLTLSQPAQTHVGIGCTSMSGVHREVAGHGSGVRGVRGARAGRGRMTSVKIVGYRETSRFVRTSRALTRVVAHVGSVRTLPRTRQFFRWAKPCSTGALTAASALLDSF